MASSFDIVAQLQLQAPTNVTLIANNIKSQIGNIKANINIGLVAGQNQQLTNLNNRLVTMTKNLNAVEAGAIGAAKAIGLIATSLSTTSSRLNSFQAYLRSVSTGFANLGGTVKPAADTMEHFGVQSALAARRFTAFTISAGAIFGVVTGIKAGLSEAISFEQQIVKIGQITQQSTKSLSGLVDEITNLSTTYGVSSKALVDISDTLAQAGLSARDTKTALEALAKTTLAPTFGDIKNTVEGSIAAISQFGINAQDLEKVLGSINSVAAAFAVESQDLTTVISKAGGVFKTLSGDLDSPTKQLNQLIALFTSVRSTTREGADQIATGLRTIFGRLERPATIQFLETFGVKLTDVKGKFIGVFPAVEQLNKALKDLDPRDVAYARIVEQIGGLRQLSRVIPLIQQFPVALRALEVAQTGQNSLTVDAIRSQESFAQKLAKVKEEYLDLFRVISKNVVFKNLAEGFLQLATAVAKLGKALEPVIPLLTTLTLIKAVPAAYSFATGFARSISTQGVLRRSTGGPVPGYGTGDSVPAYLEPKEFVIRKSSAKSIGGEALNYMNRYGEIPQKKGFGDEINEFIKRIKLETPQGKRTALTNYSPAMLGLDKYSPEELQDYERLKNLKKYLRDRYIGNPRAPKGLSNILDYLVEGGHSIGQPLFRDAIPKIKSLIPNAPNLELLGQGVFGAAIAAPGSKTVTRIGIDRDIGDSNFVRDSSQFTLQALKTQRVGNLVVEQLPYAQSLNDLGFNRGLITVSGQRSGSKITSGLLVKFKTQIEKAGLKDQDIHYGNIGFFNRKLISIDPDAVGYAHGELVTPKDIERAFKNKKIMFDSARPDLYKENRRQLSIELPHIFNSFKNQIFPHPKRILNDLNQLHIQLDKDNVNYPFENSQFPFKEVSGYYNPTYGEIRSNSRIPTIVHELAHSIDHNAGGDPFNHSKFASEIEGTRYNKLKDQFLKVFLNPNKFIDHLRFMNNKDPLFDYYNSPKEIFARGVEHYIGNKAHNRIMNLQYDQNLYDKYENRYTPLLRAKGGLIPGYGRGDSVPAMLTPEEYVINKDSAKSIGYSNLRYMNERGKIPGYNQGGIVGMADGGLFGKSYDFQTVYNRLSPQGQESLRNQLNIAVRRQYDIFGAEYDEIRKGNIARRAFNLALKKGDTIIVDAFGNLEGFGRTVKNVREKIEANKAGFNEVSQALGTSNIFGRLGKFGKAAAIGAGIGGTLLAPEILQASLGSDKGQAVTAGASGAVSGYFLGAIGGPLIGALTAVSLGLSTFQSSLNKLREEKEIKDNTEKLARFNEILSASVNKPGLDFTTGTAIKGSAGILKNLQQEASNKGNERSFFGLLPNLEDIGATDFERNQRRQRASRDFLFQNALSGLSPASQKLESIAFESKSIEDLKSKQGGAGGVLISYIAQLRAITDGTKDYQAIEKELIQSLTEEINKRQKQVKLVQANDDLADKFKDLYNNLGEFATGLQLVSSRIEDLSGGLGDVLGGSNLKLRGIAGDLTTQPTRFNNDSAFREAVGKLLGPLGDTGKEIGGFVIQQRRAIAELDPILKSVSRTASTTNVIDSVRTQLGGKGISPKVIENVIGRLQELGGEDQNPEKILIKLEQDTADTIRKVTKDLLDFTTPLGQAGQSMDKLNQQLGDSANRLVKFGEVVIEERSKIAEITLSRQELSARRLSDVQGGSPLRFISLQQQFEPFRQRVTGLAGTTNPEQIGRNITELGKQLDELRENASNINDSASKLKFAELQSQIQNSKRALELLANASERSAKIEERLSILKQQEEGRFDFFKRLVTAGPEDLPQLNKEAGAAQIGLNLFQRGGSLDQLPQILRQSVAQALTGTFANFPFRSVNNLTGNDILRQFGQRGLPSLGLPPGVVTANFAERGEKLGLEREQDRIFNEAARAQQQIVEVYQQAVNQEREIFGKSVDQFSSAVADFTKAITSEYTKNNNKSTIESGEILRNALGRSPANTDIGLIKQFQSNKADIQTAKQAQDQLKILNNIDFNKLNSPYTVLNSQNGLDKVNLNSNILDKVGKLTGGAIGPPEIQDIFNAEKKKLLDEIKDNTRLPVTNFLLGPTQKLNDLQTNFDKNLTTNFNQAIINRVGQVKEEKISDIEAARNKIGDNFGILTSRFEEFGKVLEKVDLSNFDKLIDKLQSVGQVQGFSGGGRVFKPHGTDTIPAMLSPDEFVVNASSSRANRGLLDKVNAAKGPVYLAEGNKKKPLTQAEQDILDEQIKAKKIDYSKLSKEDNSLVKQTIKDFRASGYINYQDISRNIPSSLRGIGRKNRDDIIIPSNLRSISKYERAINILNSGKGDVRIGPFKELNKNASEIIEEPKLSLLEQLSDIKNLRAQELKAIKEKRGDKNIYPKKIRALAEIYKDYPTQLKFEVSRLVTLSNSQVIAKESKPEIRAIKELEQRMLSTEDVIKDSPQKTKPFTGFTGGPRKNSKAYRIATQSIPDYGAYGGPSLPTISSARSPVYSVEDIGGFNPQVDIVSTPVIQTSRIRTSRVRTPSSTIDFTAKPSTVGRPRSSLAATSDIVSTFGTGGSGARVIDIVNSSNLPPDFQRTASGQRLDTDLVKEIRQFASSANVIPSANDIVRSQKLGDAAQIAKENRIITEGFRESQTIPLKPENYRPNQLRPKPDIPAPYVKKGYSLRFNEYDLDTAVGGFGLRQSLADIRASNGVGGEGFGSIGGFDTRRTLNRDIANFTKGKELSAPTSIEEDLAAFIQGKPLTSPTSETATVTSRGLGALKSGFNVGLKGLAAYNLYQSGSNIVNDIQNDRFGYNNLSDIGIGILSASQLAGKYANKIPLVGRFNPALGPLANVAYGAGGAYEAYQAGYGNVQTGSYDDNSFQRGATRAIAGAGALALPGIGVGIAVGEAGAYAIENYNPVAQVFGGISRDESERLRAESTQSQFTEGTLKEANIANVVNKFEKSLGKRNYVPYSQFNNYEDYYKGLQKSGIISANTQNAAPEDLELFSQFEYNRQAYRTQLNTESAKAREAAANKVNNIPSYDELLKRRQEFFDPTALLFKADGGSIFKRRGTDTIPAMLSPDEFVVNATSAKANRGLLDNINAAKGPIYRAGGGIAKYTDEDIRRILSDEEFGKRLSQRTPEPDSPRVQPARLGGARRFRDFRDIPDPEYGFKGRKGYIENLRDSILKRRAAAFNNKQERFEGNYTKVKASDITDEILQDRIKSGDIDSSISGFDVKQEQRRQAQEAQSSRINDLQAQRRQAKADRFNQNREDAANTRQQRLDFLKVQNSPEARIAQAAQEDLFGKTFRSGRRTRGQLERFGDTVESQARILPGNNQPQRDLFTPENRPDIALPVNIRGQAGLPQTQAGATPGAATSTGQIGQAPAFDVGALNQPVQNFGGFIDLFGKHVKTLNGLTEKLTDLKVTIQTDKLVVTVAEKDILTEINKNMQQIIQSKIDKTTTSGSSNGQLE